MQSGTYLWIFQVEAIMKRGKPRELRVQRMKFYPYKLFVTQEAGEQEDRNVTWRRRAQYKQIKNN